MAGIPEGHGASKEAEILKKLGDELLVDVWDAWRKQRGVHCPAVDEVLYSKVSFVALMQMAATIAVDINIGNVKFMEIAASLFQEAFDKAPKFGA